jgi:hypothetical protein
MTIQAKFPGTCSKCFGRFSAGTMIDWQRGKGSSHTTCSTQGIPTGHGTTRYPGRSRSAERLNPDSKYWAGRGYGDGDL